jgi:hypothetical protein
MPRSIIAVLKRRSIPLCLAVIMASLLTANLFRLSAQTTGPSFDNAILLNAGRMLSDGRRTFRSDTFGDEAFWGDTLQLHKAIEGSKFGGIGPGVSPATALAVGLKVDVSALPPGLADKIRTGQLDLNDPANTLALMKLNAVVGITGFFNADGSLKSMGIQCALCHSTVDDSLAFGIGRRLDGWANRDLNVGAIISLAPNLTPVVNLLKIANPSITEAQVKQVLAAWGPGKFDAELFLDGKATNPVTGGSAATLLPNAYGLGGYNQHTWTGGWGNVAYWNAFVANLEMHGIGTFFDPRLDNAAQYPIAAAMGFGHLRVDPETDRITKKLPALQYYQLSIPAPKPRAGVDFIADAAVRGDELFNGKAKCGTCHVEPIWTEPGWNVHKPEDIKIESFQADRSPDHSYKTMNLAGIFIRERGIHMAAANKGRYYHDGRFKTLLDVVNSYNTRFGLGLTDPEKSDLVEYLKSL